MNDRYDKYCIELRPYQIKFLARFLRKHYAANNRLRVNKPPAGEQELLRELLDVLSAPYQIETGGKRP